MLKLSYGEYVSLTPPTVMDGDGEWFLKIKLEILVMIMGDLGAV